MRVGLLGAGAINLWLARASAESRIPNVEIVALSTRKRTTRADEIISLAKCQFVTEPQQLLDHEPQLIVEAAHRDVVRDHALAFAQAGVDLVLLSAGPLLENNLFEDLWQASRDVGCRITLPSGGIGSLDVLRAAAHWGRVDEVHITQIKDPHSWLKVPGGEEADPDSPTRQKLFEGSAADAVKQFPTHLNMAASVSLAGIGPERTQVVVYSDPDEVDTVHRLEIKGDFGSSVLELRPAPNPDKPHGSLIAALSAIEAVQMQFASVRIGS